VMIGRVFDHLQSEANEVALAPMQRSVPLAK